MNRHKFLVTSALLGSLAGISWFAMLVTAPVSIVLLVSSTQLIEKYLGEWWSCTILPFALVYLAYNIVIGGTAAFCYRRYMRHTRSANAVAS
ncbi:MAG: hypothetical protein WC702_01215 [Patescibacteria group bacterium]